MELHSLERCCMYLSPQDFEKEVLAAGNPGLLAFAFQNKEALRIYLQQNTVSMRELKKRKPHLLSKGSLLMGLE